MCWRLGGQLAATLLPTRRSTLPRRRERKKINMPGGGKGKMKQGGNRNGEAIFRWVVRKDLSEEGICEQESEMCRRESGET